MNSRERLHAVLDGKIPDRVPVSTYELVGYNSQSFENQEPSYARLMAYIRENTDCICMRNPAADETFLASSSPVEITTEEIRESDCLITYSKIQTPCGELTRTVKKIDNVQTYWQTEHWCKSIEDVDKALSVPYEPVHFDWSDLARIQAELGSHGLLMPSLSDPLLLAADLMDFGEFTIWAMTETEHFARTVEVLHERNMENLRQMLDGHVADMYRIVGPEYACPPFLPPVYFEKFVLPYVKEMVDLIHARGGKVRLHCHGRVSQVFEYIIATGADGMDPCEAPPDGDITLAELKQQADGRIALFGNIQLKLLEQGTPGEIRDAVKLCMDSAKEGGRFVLMPTAAPINIPLSPQTEENYYHFIEAGLELGKY
jgi:uroporphyrinogen-III decarboxylase